LSRYDWEQASNLFRKRKPTRLYLGTALMVTAASVLVAGASAATAATQGTDGRALIANTAPGAGAGKLTALAAGSQVRLSVFVGQDQAGLAAAAAAVSNPQSSSYRHYLSPAQVQARFGATAAQQSAVRSWLTGSGLTVTHDDGFIISAMGTTTKAEAALQTGLALSAPSDGTEQVVPSKAMSVPAALTGAISTIRVSTATVAATPHQPLKPATSIAHSSATATATATSTAADTSASSASSAECSDYYGQKPATGLPTAYGRTLTWAPCGYTPTQLRDAYGATQTGLTGAGTTVAILSADAGDGTALSDTDEWSEQQHIPQFAPGQFTAYGPADSDPGSVEDALDIEAVHGMAPAADIDYVTGTGEITGDPLLDALDTVVQQHLADVVTTSWYEAFMPAADTMVTSWEGVLEQAALEGITVDAASGDFGSVLPLQYPSSDPWITAVGGTSLAVGAGGDYLWETAWESDETSLAADGQSWSEAPPGDADGGSVGGVSQTFAEPSYQDGVVSGNVVNGEQMRTVPDVSAFADWGLGYQIGLSTPDAAGQNVYTDEINGGTSLSAPLFAGFEADLIQGRGGAPLGFANPLLYQSANTAAFHDVTADPQGPGYTEAVVYQPAASYTIPNPPPALLTLGQCGTKDAPTCGPGYDLATGLGSPGPAFFRAFGAQPTR
jgi:subtilase family serine protease